jgi:hydroxymethylglutaryl-CoA reductase
MVERGGGVVDLRFKQLSSTMLVVELLVNVCESMGANIINTIAEACAPYIQEKLQQGRVGIRILSNLCTERMTMSTFRIPLEKMGWKGVPGAQVAAKMVEAQTFAELD